MKTQTRILNYKYSNVNKSNMVFVIEFSSQEEATYTYKSESFFDAILEFYAFINAWAVEPVNSEDASE